MLFKRKKLNKLQGQFFLFYYNIYNIKRMIILSISYIVSILSLLYLVCQINTNLIKTIIIKNVSDYKIL